MKDPRISVLASEALLAQLMNACQALKNSRTKGVFTDRAELHALVVQITEARRRAAQVADAAPPG
jgi:hypothetical protein